MIVFIQAGADHCCTAEFDFRYSNRIANGIKLIIKKQLFKKTDAESVIGQVEDAMNDFDSLPRRHKVAFIVWALMEKHNHDGKKGKI